MVSKQFKYLGSEKIKYHEDLFFLGDVSVVCPKEDFI